MTKRKELYIPKELKIGPHTFKVTELLPKDADGFVGRCHRDLCEIQVVPEDHGTQTMLDDTILHEALHGMWRVYNMSDLISTQDPEESMVSLLAPVLLQFMRENKEWVQGL